jgi:hypothetical protein
LSCFYFSLLFNGTFITEVCYCTLSWASSIRFTTFMKTWHLYFCKSYFNLVYHQLLGLSSGLFQWGFLFEIVNTSLIYCMPAKCPVHS